MGEAVTAAQRRIYKVASYSISPSCYCTENCLCRKQLTDDEAGAVPLAVTAAVVAAATSLSVV